MKPPCKGCDKRSPTCHASCPDYLAFRDRQIHRNHELDSGRAALDFLCSSNRAKAAIAYLRKVKKR